MHPGIPRRVRYLIRYLAARGCAPGAGSYSRTADYTAQLPPSAAAVPCECSAAEPARGRPGYLP